MEEIQELEKKYKSGEEVLPKYDERERTLRERQREDEDRRLVSRVQVESLRERGLDGRIEETAEERRERRRRREERARMAGRREGRESSRDTSRDRVTAVRREVRREAGDSSGGEGQRMAPGRGRRDRQVNSMSSVPTLHPDPEREERRRRRRERSADESAAAGRRRDDELRRRNVEAAERDRSAARQIEHQSSLRSLISSSDVDTAEVEEEILRQIREEGLLDGIDLENIDAAEETRISERIAEAFRRRQEERNLFLPERSAATMARTRERSASNREERRPVLSTRTGGTGTTQYPPRSGERRQHSRSLSARSANEDYHRNPRQQFLEPHSSDEARVETRRRRDTSRHSSRRSATSPSPSSSPAVRAIGHAQRSNTDIADRERRMVADTTPIRPVEGRTTSDPQTHQTSNSMADVVEEANRRRRGPPPVLPPRELPVRERERAREREQAPTRVVAELDVASSPVELDTPPRRDHVRAQSQTSTPVQATTAVPAPIAANVPLPVELDSQQTQPGLAPAPLTPSRPTQSHDRGASTASTALERALTLSATSRPTSSSSAASNATRNLPRYPEPSISCNRCQKQHIEYNLHYSCSICANGTWNLCLSCYRAGKGCLHWFGFGYSAFTKFSALKSSGQLPPNSNPPHMLYAERYGEPVRIPGGAEGRRTLTTEDPEKRLQTGAFCAGCQAWANECYWRCDTCNEGDWGFCNSCVNQGWCCTHPLLPLLYVPKDAKHDGSLHVVNPDPGNVPPRSPVYAHPPPAHASLLTGPNAVAFGSFKPLSFNVLCDICRSLVPPSAERFHCYKCTSAAPGSEKGDYDICMPCYHSLISSRRISPENGPQGWRRCPQGHRIVVLRFEDLKGGQRRVVVRDLMGGWTLSQEPLQGGPAVTISTLHPRTEHEKWAWANGLKCRLVTKDVGAVAAQVSTVPGMVLQGFTSEFPPEGGSGIKAVALWSWWPAEESNDELAFPKGSEIREVVDVNGDWFFGAYMGTKGLFPAPYVRV